MWSNGNYDMIQVAANGSGDNVKGIVKVGGMYPATVDFSNLKVRGYAFTGNYRITFKNELGTKSVGATRN